MKIEDVIIKPVLTEKATQASSRKVYTFQVNNRANKNQVRTVLETVYKVKVDNIRISIRKGKMKRVGKRMVTKQLSDRKIAFITLKEGSIPVFPQV
ncbi:MAG: 50S ribosomal protein L23 [Patescibacteria group bacterium]